MQTLFWVGICFLIGLILWGWVYSSGKKYLTEEAAIIPEKVEGEAERPRELGVVHRVVVNGAAVELCEEMRFLDFPPRARRRPFVRVVGEIRTPLEAREVSRVVAEMEGQLRAA